MSLCCVICKRAFVVRRSFSQHKQEPDDYVLAYIILLYRKEHTPDFAGGACTGMHLRKAAVTSDIIFYIN